MRGVLVVAIAAAVVAAMATHALVEGQRELSASGTLLAAGDMEQALVRARRSASWYVPGAPHVPLAYERMIGIARVSEGRSDPRTALLAWQAVREAALSSRWLEVPHQQQLGEANAAIARLQARRPQPQAAPERSEVERERDILLLLNRQEHPYVSWVVVMLAGFGLFSGGLAWFSLRALDEAGQLCWRRVRPALLVTGAGALAWIVALWRA
jgi:hypothetical protein